MKTFIVDVSRCNGCHNCQIACKDEHVDNDWTPYAKPQPDTGHFWIKINELVRGSVPKVKISYVPLLCMHCDNPPCLSACAANAIYKRRDGLVIIDPEKCNGCQQCIDSCPYGAMYFNQDLKIVQKCTGCAHLLDSGWKEPRCVEACPTTALSFIEEDELKELTLKAELMHPELNTKPRVHYLELPRKFIAGAIYDPEADECIEGALITVTDTDTNVAFTAESDNYGDFWFLKLNEGTYSLTVEKEGYLPETINSISTEKDINLGDIGLRRKLSAF
ncbi:MAG: carboxypeptidase regulatory-like domain-containing protein [Dehalococcoidales bacterium]|nr:carboxypeptidase regulatory-like domain-containing protein [Dehalococcoidales bacterium]